MKKIILTTALIVAVIISYSQKLGESKLPFADLLKAQQTKGDTIWLFHRYDINQWKDGEFHPYMANILDYYPGTANLKYGIVLNTEVQDTLQKYNFYYDDSNRVIATVMQNYTGNSGNVWVNYDSVTQFYNNMGLDSLFVRYIWNSSDTAWKKHDLRGISYYENTLNNLKYIDSSSIWNGQEWIMSEGNKRDYLFNKFGNVYDKKYSIYQGGKWVYDYWIAYYLSNDTTGEYDALDNYIWKEGEWTNYIRLSDVVLHAWKGYTNYVAHKEHSVTEAWDGQQWYYVKKDSILWDTLGSWTLYQYYWEDDIGWDLKVRINDVYNERGLRTLITKEGFINNKWDTITGDRYSFEYLGSIWKAMHYERYDTALMKWLSAYDHILSDFTYILNSAKPGETGMSSGIRLIPNPAKNTILIALNDETDRIKSVKVFDISGRVMFSKKFDAVHYRERLDISTLKKGTYILNVKTRSGKYLKDKFIRN